MSKSKKWTKSKPRPKKVFGVAVSDSDSKGYIDAALDEFFGVKDILIDGEWTRIVKISSEQRQILDFYTI